MILALIAITLLLAVLAYLGRAGSRPLAERAVDLPYRNAALAAAVAHSADSALCRYRRVRSDIAEAHVAQYAQEGL